MSEARESGGRLPTLSPRLGAALLCVALTVWWIATLEIEKSWAWDESMHAELPALRMLFSLQAGDLQGFWNTLHSCHQYPFGWPLVLAVVQSVFGISEGVARAAGIAAWGTTLFGMFLLGEEVARAQSSGAPRRGDDLLPWLALGFGVLSPLALGYAESLFLEVPFTLCAVFALRAWLRRRNLRNESGATWRALACGLWLTAAFFTKFNYGILLVFGLTLDALVGLVFARAERRQSHELRSLLIAALPLALALAWWVVLPLPFGLERGREHLRVMLDFLGSNQQMASTPWQQRVVFWALYLSFTARLLVLQLVGAGASLRGLFRPGVRCLWIVFLATGLPVWTHNFHLDRFLIPGAPAFWVLAAAGLATLVPAASQGRAVVLAVLALVTLAVPTLDAPRVAGALGLLDTDEHTRAYILEVLEEKPRLGAGRHMWTPGIHPEGAGAVLELVTAEVGPAERVGWIGVSTEIPPAVLHMALLETSGNRARFLADAHRPVDVTFTGNDPGWDAGRLAHFVQDFDVVITTDPPDIGQRVVRLFSRRYAGMLIGELGWSVRELGKVSVAPEVGPELELTVYALRPPAP